MLLRNKYMADIRPDRLTTCQSERKSVVSRRPSVYIKFHISKILLRSKYWTGEERADICRLVIYRINGFSDFVHHPDSEESENKNTTFRKPDLFPSSGEGRHLLCWVPYKELTSILTWNLICLRGREANGVASVVSGMSPRAPTANVWTVGLYCPLGDNYTRQEQYP
jgi:hypothetical protein